MSLGHTDRELGEALLRVSLNLLGSLGQELNVGSAIDLLCNSPDLLLDTLIQVVEEPKVVGLGTHRVHSPRLKPV